VYSTVISFYFNSLFIFLILTVLTVYPLFSCNNSRFTIFDDDDDEKY